MKTSSIAVETSRSISQSDSIVRQTNKRSFLIHVIFTMVMSMILMLSDDNGDDDSDGDVCDYVE